MLPGVSTLSISSYSPLIQLVQVCPENLKHLPIVSSICYHIKHILEGSFSLYAGYASEIISVGLSSEKISIIIHISYVNYSKSYCIISVMFEHTFSSSKGFQEKAHDIT